VNTIEILILFIMAFLPPIIFAIWIRNTERYNRERWIPIILCFIWGATIAIIAALILEIILQIPLYLSFRNFSTIGLLTAVVIAPFAEELTKPLGLRLKRVDRELDELEDGLIYGAVAGLGFSATENLLYGFSFLIRGESLDGYSLGSFLFVFILFMCLRSFGGCLLHAAASAWTGYGIGKAVISKTSKLRIIPYFILACFFHGLYNFLVTFQLNGVIIGLFAALAFAGFSIYYVRKKIRILDMVSA